MAEKIFSLKEIENLLNVKAHTLRTWEKRYAIVCPKRNRSNIRCYSLKEKELLANILLLKEHGYKLRHIAKWDHVKIRSTAQKLVQAEQLTGKWLNDILDATLVFDQSKIQSVFKQVSSHYSFDCLVNKVLLPLFDQFNLLWLTGSVHALHERFLGQLVCSQLTMEIESLENQQEFTKRNTILFSPDGPQKEYLLKIIHYKLKKEHYEVTYLGCKVSPDELTELPHSIPIHDWNIFISEDFVNINLEQYANHLQELLGSKPIHLIAHPAPRDQYNHPNVSIIKGIRKLSQFLKESYNKVK